MNKTTLIASAVVAIGVPIAARLYYNGLISDLVERFPDLDRKVIRKAYHRFHMNALAGKYGDDMDPMTDEQMDALFLDIVREQTASS